jgi:hypothetical protein
MQLYILLSNCKLFLWTSTEGKIDRQMNTHKCIDHNTQAGSINMTTQMKTE